MSGGTVGANRRTDSGPVAPRSAVPPSSAGSAVCLASPTAAHPRSARAADSPPWDVVVRAATTGRLPVDKHVVGDVHGTPSEGDAAVQRHVHKYFDHLVLGEADVQRTADVATQGAFTSQRGQAGHRAQTAAGQVEAGTRPGGAPVVFAGDATKRPFSLGRWRWSRGRLGSHILHPQLVAPLEQAVGVFV